MIYRLLRSSLLALLKAPLQPPEAPAGNSASVEVFRASPRYLVYRLLGLGSVASIVVLVALGLGGAATFGDEPELLVPVVVGAALILGLLSLAYFFVRVDYDLRYYVVTDRSLRVREGAWSVHEQTVTFANIQNLHVEQGPLMRLLGLWNLRIEVAGGGGQAGQEAAGGGGHHATFAGIENAHDVRDQILGHLRSQPAGSGLGDLDEFVRPEQEGGVSAALLEAVEGVSEASARLAGTARARLG